MKQLTKKSASKKYVQFAKQLVTLQKDDRDQEAKNLFNAITDPHVSKSVLNTIEMLHANCFCKIFK